MTTTSKIALCGKMRSGKDTVANYLVENLGFQKFAFGDGIRRVCSVLYPEEMAKGKPRAILQGVGQALRQYDPDVWVNYCLQEVERSRAERVIISDLRQPNEFERLRRDGWFIVRINAWEELRVERARAAGDNFNDADLTHETETYVDSFPVDYEIANVADLYTLQLSAEILARLVTQDWSQGVNNNGSC